MARCNFSRPRLESIENPARDIVKLMPEVDPHKRITVIRALEHQWIIQSRFAPGCSSNSLVRKLQNIGFRHKKINWERTLLADMPGVMPSNTNPVQTQQNKEKGKNRYGFDRKEADEDEAEDGKFSSTRSLALEIVSHLQHPYPIRQSI
ncbi:serine/threonine protein kinase [Rhizina undulata]